MLKAYDQITHVSLLAGAKLSHPPSLPEVIHLTDPALSVMVKLETKSVTYILPSDYITEPLVIEKAKEEHILFVVDEQKQFLGILTAEDIGGIKPYQLMQEKSMQRAEIQAQFVMTPYSEILSFDIESLRHAKVSNIVTTLSEKKQSYALVLATDPVDKSQTILGFYWAATLSEGLGFDIMGKEVGAQNLLDLQRNFR